MIKKVTAFLIAGTMLIIVVPSHNKVTAEAKVNSINYDFLNNEPGMASGKITISTTTPGDYQLYWADDKGKPQEIIQVCLSRTYKCIIKINKTKITKIGKSKKISKKSKKYKTQINYKKIPNAYKYEIQYGNDKKFKATKTKRTKNTKYTISKLKNKKTYYIRVRAYGYQFGERVYGKWSITKKLKIKRKK